MTLTRKTICLCLSVSLISLSSALAMDGSVDPKVIGIKKNRPGFLQEAQNLRHKINSRLNSGFEENLKVDTAIIGAGASGLYSAYRLTGDKKYAGKKVHVFEMNHRIGGRLESVDIPLADLVAELGGMRYLTSQEIVTALIEKKFALPNISFEMGNDSYLVGYYRKQHMKASAWVDAQTSITPEATRTEPFKTRYYLDDKDIGHSADQLFNKVIYDVLMASEWFRKKYKDNVRIDEKNPCNRIFNLNREQWDDIKLNLTYCFEHSPSSSHKSPYYNKKLNDFGFWNLLRDQIGQEGYNFLADAGAYYSNTINWNAAEAFPYMIGDFSGPNVQYRTIEGGYDLIAYKLAEEYLESSDKATIWAEKKLINFRHSKKENGYKYALTFLNIPTQAKWKVYANQIILAMPRRSLELLDQSNFFFLDRKLQNNMKSVIMEPACKILLAFEEPWWQQGQKEQLFGHSITDLPMRQCYYFGIDPQNSHALLLASYNDMHTVPFWTTLAYKPTVEKHQQALEKSIRKQEEEKSFLEGDIKVRERTTTVRENNIEREEKVFGLRIKRVNKINKTPQKPDSEDKIKSYSESLKSNPCLNVMVQELINQLQELHKGSGEAMPEKKVTQPYVAMFKDWSADPYGAGYHAWESSYPVEQVVPYMRKPSSTENVFICGEAYSNQQGWVEGAFCIAEKMLQEHFELDWPEWLTNKDYYLGW